jgi:hypothetical protein
MTALGCRVFGEAFFDRSAMVDFPFRFGNALALRAIS